jgi:hypothetical protein
MKGSLEIYFIANNLKMSILKFAKNSDHCSCFNDCTQCTNSLSKFPLKYWRYRTHCHLQIRVQCYDHYFGQFSPRKLAFLLKIISMIHFFRKLAVDWNSIFRQIFRRKCSKNNYIRHQSLIFFKCENAGEIFLGTSQR